MTTSRETTTLLLIENEPGVCDDIKAVLENRGFHVLSCYRIAQASKHLDRGLPDVFLFDIALSDILTGFEFALQLVERYGLLPSRFFFLSAWADRFDRPQEFPEDHIFSKPLDRIGFDRIARHLHDTARPNREE